MTEEQEISKKISYVRTPDITDADRDLGFGEKVATETRLRFLNRDGTFNVARRGLRRFSTLNLYHFLLTMSWSHFLGLLLLLYFLSNLFFAFLYSSLGASSLIDTSEIPTESLFVRAFFFSVQTFATIGYGTIHPVGTLPNLLVTLESYYSLLINALITGLVFARFSRPTAKIIFSEPAVVAPYRENTGLMFRLVNNRHSQLIELKAQVLFSRFTEKDGKTIRRFDVLELERQRVAFFPLAWTIVHPIDENSPMFGMTEEKFREIDAEILVMLSAIDETFSQTVFTRSSYKADEIKFGYKFANLYNNPQNGEPISIDIRKLSEVERA